jgi:signal transduction histidine kinase
MVNSLTFYNKVNKLKEAKKITIHRYDQFLNLYVKAYGYYDKFIVCDTLNNLIYTSGTTTDSLHLSLINNPDHVCISQLINSVYRKKNVEFLDFKKDPFNENKPSYYLSAPVYDDHKTLIGFISLLVSTKAINNIMLENSSENGLGETGESYIVGRDFYMRSDSRFIPKSLMNQVVKTQSSLNAFEGKLGAEIINDYRNITVLSSYSKLNIPGINWIIIAEIDLKEAMIPVERTRNDILLLSTLLILFILGITYIIARTISQPIIRLKNASIKVGEGDFTTKIEVIGSDEIGALTKSFNSMTSKLKTTRDVESALKEEREKRLSALIDGQEMERQRVSRELHDGLGQYLIAIKLKLENIITQQYRGEKEPLLEVQEMFNKTIDEIRKISDNLMPSILKEFGIETALRNLCKMVSYTSGINIQFESLSLKKRPDVRTSIYLYRISQEALNNVVKHANASEVTLQLLELGRQIQLIIEDNGKGFNFDHNFKSMGNGIFNMRERTDILGGSFVLHSLPGKGTKIEIKITLHE